MNKIILIGGAPTVGKTHTARRLSKKLNFPWVSTDGVREMMREIVRKTDYPNLFHEPGITAEKYLKKYSPKEIVKNQIKESVEVWKAVSGLIKTDYVWKSFIVEGVAILPCLINKTFKGNKSIKPVFLLNKNIKQITKVVYTRGLWDDAGTYSDEVKDFEVEWAYLFNEYIEKEAKKYGYPVYEIKKINFRIDDIEKLCE